jgi:hypothetical protein
MGPVLLMRLDTSLYLTEVHYLEVFLLYRLHVSLIVTSSFASLVIVHRYNPIRF